MKKNFIKKATTALVAVMSVASAAMITTKATGNYGDTDLGITFSYQASSNPHTATRDKNDYTPSYIKSKDSTYYTGNLKYSYTVYVYGSQPYLYEAYQDSNFQRYGRDSSGKLNVSNCTYGSPVYVTPGTEHYLDNLVRENGYKYAFLLLWQKKEGDANITGVWSPDSV